MDDTRTVIRKIASRQSQMIRRRIPERFGWRDRRRWWQYSGQPGGADRLQPVGVRGTRRAHR
jgi:hypothetical protein